MNLLRLLSAGLVTIFCLMPHMASAQESTTLKFLTAWDARFQGTKVIAHKYAEMVKESSKGRIKFQFSGPEVVKPKEQFQPNSSGVFDLMFSTPVYYLGTTGAMLGFYALPPDIKQWRAKGYRAFAEKELARFNLKLIAIVSSGYKQDTYQIMLKKPLAKGDKPFAGLKIRGNIFYKPLVVPLGGSLVNLNGGEIYSALQKGVVDGAAWPVVGAVNFKFHEVAKYAMRPRFGQAPYTITMNMDRFNKLSKADQDLLIKTGETLENEAPKAYAKVSEEEIAQLTKLGVKETHLDKDVFDKINKGFLKGVWNIAVNFNKKTKERAQALYDMAKKNGDAE